MSVVNRQITLVLNSAWQPIGWSSVRKAIVAMTSTQDGENMAAKAIDFKFEQNADGSFNQDNPISMIPVEWQDWIQLPIRDFDLVIHTAHRLIRVPTVIIAVNFGRMPMRHLRPTRQGIFERDNFTCQYSGRKLPKSQLNIDHIRPKSSKGGEDWTNLVACDKRINSEKGARTPDQAGLKLIRVPKSPLPIPMSSLIKEARHRDWKHFIKI